MSASVTLAAAGGVLIAAGVTLLLERTLSRLLVGVLVLSNGVNLLILTAGGGAGRAPILEKAPPGVHPARPMSDPLPQAMILTAIVISLASAAFVLSIAYRSGRQGGDDDVRDDVEDRRVARGRSELRAQIRARRREYRRLRRERRREARRARAELRERIRAERERRAVDDPTLYGDDADGGAQGTGGHDPDGTGGAR
ncbi:Na(+)/H(+) antiporter subunit C [Spirillospora sp. NPDC029432]|uniref:Na(+)/H(+) antiporter subunit C n=1 Tax=Spirillospora sp. NPDC029432 TaxID=3154599 RepID=UPI0034573966